LLPDARATNLLAAMLLEGDAAREAWSRWTRSVCAPKQALAADTVMARSLLALLYDSVRRNDLPVDDDTATYLRSAFHTESLRTRAYREIRDDLHERLHGVPYLLIKGAAVGELYYRDAVLRHAHDLELLTSDRATVHGALAGSRFRPLGEHYVHESGLPLRVHTRLCVSIDTLDATTALALTLVHASRSPSRATCRWVCDAAYIIRSRTVDWPCFTQIAIDAGGAAAAHAQLQWLRDALGVAVPAEPLAMLEARLPWWRRIIRRRKSP
jgi:hypothetical protein